MTEKMKIKKISGKGFKILILEKNKEIARAFLYILTNDLHKKPFGLVEDVFVKENYRNKGYGAKIMKVLIKEAKKNGCYKLICTSRFSRPKTHRFYKKLGFEKYGYEFRINML